MTMKIKTDSLKVIICAKARERISHYVALAKGEVSGLGLVDEIRDEKGKLIGFFVSDVYLVKQVSSAVTTELDEKAVSDLLVELDEKNVDIGKVKLWWHSHCDMKTFWSSTDTDCVEGLSNGSYFISLVTNKNNDVLCRVDLYSPFRIALDEVTVETAMPDFGLLEECKVEFAAKVKESSFGLSSYGLESATSCLQGDDYYDFTDAQVKQLNELESKVEEGLITYGEYCEQFFEMTGERMIPFGLNDSGFIN